MKREDKVPGDKIWATDDGGICHGKDVGQQEGGFLEVGE